MGGTLKIFLGVFLRSRETVKIYGYRAAARILSDRPPPNKFEGATHCNLSDCLNLLFLSILNKTPNYTLKTTLYDK